MPQTHLVDGGYTSSPVLAASQKRYQVELLGPARANFHWQAKASKGFSVDDFQIDWQQEQAICPAGRVSSSWTLAQDNRGKDVIKLKFSVKDCKPCPLRELCTRSKLMRRSLTIRTDEAYHALQRARTRQKAEHFADDYALRAGIEGIISQAVRGFDLRRSRYLGFAKTHLQHVLIAIGNQLCAA